MLELVPITQAAAKDFVRIHHRHHKPPVGSVFQIAAAVNGLIVAVIIVGRPVSRIADDGFTLEVTRLCTISYPNSCSKLYAAAWRVTRSLGYHKLITYILESEKGTSLKASGWNLVGCTKGRSWHCTSRPRIDNHPLDDKLKFEIH
jgi:hypothetical protein